MRLYAHVIMENHIHLIVSSLDLSKTMQSFNLLQRGEAGASRAGRSQARAWERGDALPPRSARGRASYRWSIV